jgi:hypothetical protein
MDKPSPICKPNLKFTLVKTTTSKMKYFPILDTIMTLSDDQIAFYRENKFIKIKDVFEGPELLYYAEIIKDKVDFLSRGTKALEDRDTYGRMMMKSKRLRSLSDWHL